MGTSEPSLLMSVLSLPSARISLARSAASEEKLLLRSGVTPATQSVPGEHDTVSDGQSVIP